MIFITSWRQEKVRFHQWINSSLIHDNIFSLIREKCHLKSYHSDIKYHMTLNIIFSVLVCQKTSFKYFLGIGIWGHLQHLWLVSRFPIPFFENHNSSLETKSEICFWFWGRLHKAFKIFDEVSSHLGVNPRSLNACLSTFLSQVSIYHHSICLLSTWGSHAAQIQASFVSIGSQSYLTSGLLWAKYFLAKG